MTADTPLMRRAAMDLLARREHSRLELRRKLQRRFASHIELEAVLQQLGNEGLQSDARYAESLVRQRVERGYGPLRLQQELRQKGVSDTLVDEVLAAFAVDWSLLAAEVCRKKFGDQPPDNPREAARRLRFLQYRGFRSQDLAALPDARSAMWG